MNVAGAERIADLRQRWKAPSQPMNVVFIGAGAIVGDAHAPAYRLGGLPVVGAFDSDVERARATAKTWRIPRVFERIEDSFSTPDVVFDVAVPPQALGDVLARLPERAVVLIQKPFGLDLADATRLRALCRRKNFVAAVNLQLRFSPMMLALRDAFDRGALGRIVELEVLVNCRMPWELWPFMRSLARMEIALHSIHYLDVIRSLLGEPRSVYARTVKHPDAPKLASSRTSAILDYGDDVRVCLSINHHHAHGPKHQISQLRIEGTQGAAVATMGVNLDYPRGRPDALDLACDGEAWRTVPLVGNWFPDAFLGTMSNLQRFARGEDRVLHTSVEDAWHTMALVEALYLSDASRGTPLPRDEEATP
jgi:predicted dehydrogenase